MKKTKISGPAIIKFIVVQRYNSPVVLQLIERREKIK